MSYSGPLPFFLICSIRNGALRQDTLFPLQDHGPVTLPDRTRFVFNLHGDDGPLSVINLVYMLHYGLNALLSALRFSLQCVDSTKREAHHVQLPFKPFRILFDP